MALITSVPARLAIGWAGLALAATAHGGPLFRCPGNLFTNQIDPVQARSTGCREADADGLTQALLAGAAPPAVAAPEAPAAPVAAPAAVRARPPASRVAFSKARSEARYQRTSSTAPPGRSVGSPEQRVRDSDARAILQTELARTLAAQQAMASTGPGASDPAALQRLRADEAALRRELDRLTP